MSSLTNNELDAPPGRRVESTLMSTARLVREAFDAFVSQKDALLGVFFYRWEDQERCWQCGSPDCPIETAWGLVDIEGNPKPAYGAFARGVASLTAAATDTT